jgi:drug/metabolite transporter (DMT)-like permease
MLYYTLSMNKKPTTPSPARPLQWTGVLFAFAANMLLVTVSNGLVQALQLAPEFEVLATLVAPLLAGLSTALYVPYRGGMHAFLGSMVSIVVLAVFIFDGHWPPAVLAGMFCTLGGALSEVALRRLRK